MKTTIEETIKLFSLEAEKKAQANEVGDSKTANKSYDKTIKAVKVLKSNGSISSLLPLLNDNRLAVRMTAAIFLLSKYENISLPVLEAIASSEGILAFTAEMTITEWKKGNLNDYL
ncbi:hypothetical protein EOD41_17320 [Mucilaginibacter limnophilus]|uniref:DUF2019 domain-containing protein n=1 Tax=Mucilaginibacter limnophilus TaxID=1932778 RepID=A0A437MKF7_9SPHI|nr:hypothetical protein [Mucilaginibacter limnophilus]RVT98131.1 hypothetical protein EOD41_17320 [Mucilaginibacter limnophilus]